MVHNRGLQMIERNTGAEFKVEEALATACTKVATALEARAISTSKVLALFIQESAAIVRPLARIRSPACCGEPEQPETAQA
jgi:hypothetical protein